MYKIGRKKYNEQYYQKNKEKRKQEYLSNREEKLEEMKQYYLNSQKRMKRYRQSKGYREYLRKHCDTRRKLGFFALNEYFIGAEGHHISRNFVIYVPKEIHRSIGHNIWTGKNMQEINKLAINFL